MFFSNIVETRKVKGGSHSTVLEMTVDNYEKRYNEYNNEAATEIINSHFRERGDDGRPSDVRIEKDDTKGLVRIYANVNYLGNDHTSYHGGFK